MTTVRSLAGGSGRELQFRNRAFLWTEALECRTWVIIGRSTSVNAFSGSEATG